VALFWAAGLTVVVELAVLILFGYRARLVLAADGLVNVATNLTLNTVVALWPGPGRLVLIAVLEVAVVVVEWRVLRGFTDSETPAWRLPVAVLVANAASFGAGCLLWW
jgi:hypothetical protein